MAIETPTAGAATPPSFLIAGYAFDPESTSGSGVDAVAVYAYPNFGSNEPAVFLGNAEYGIPRQDVSRTFSTSANCGFQLRASGLAPGSYRLFAFARNIAAGFYSAYVFVDITIAGTRAIAIDAPAASATVSPAFEIRGWAIDGAAPDGTGVDAIHVYLAANDGASQPAFLGVATYGLSRPDVAASYGSRFANSGYQFSASGVQPGSYVLCAYAHSTVTGSFSIVATRPFTVDNTTMMSIDTPSAGATIDAPTFTVAGWAIDRVATSGSGVDALHVYAFRDPGSDQPPTFLGVAQVGVGRSDVANLFGNQFLKSGYELGVDRAALGLTPGVYDIVVWTHSSVSNAFTAVSVVRVTLR